MTKGTPGDEVSPARALDPCRRPEGHGLWGRECSSSGLSLRAGSREFCPATTSLGPGYFDTKRKYYKEKNASNYKIMN